MPEDHHPYGPEISRPSARDVAVNYGEYFAIYQLGRAEYDKPADRIPELDRIKSVTQIQFRDTVDLLDAHIERALDIRKSINGPRIAVNQEDRAEVRFLAQERLSDKLGVVARSQSDDPRKDEWGEWEEIPMDPREKANRDSMRALLERLKSPVGSDGFSSTPPDYTFASVRHPVARPLLELLNIAMVVDDEVLENPRLRSSRLAENGRKMVQELAGDDPHALLRVREVDVLTAVFERRLRLPEVPGKPLTNDGSLHMETIGELGKIDH
jgi:hypothetical protein